ncbi:hypothetical protein JL722_13805 [Aureococcus anophagefferens]|nr:hypothetical protein JL722_13805 [Aureococcus anophagefferens]
MAEPAKPDDPAYASVAQAPDNGAPESPTPAKAEPVDVMMPALIADDITLTETFDDNGDHHDHGAREAKSAMTKDEREKARAKSDDDDSSKKSDDCDEMLEELEDELTSFNTACISALCTPGTTDAKPRSSLILQTFCAILTSMVLNVLTASVQDQVTQVVEWEDDLVFGWGSTKTRHKTYWAFVYDTLVFDVPLGTVLVSGVASLVISLDLRGAFRECMLNHLLLNMCRPVVTGNKDAEPVAMWRWLVAQLLDKSVRVFNISYVSAAIFLIGTSDGTVDLVLNCTALNFLLSVDNLLGETFALFSRKAFGLDDDSDDFIEGIPSQANLREMCRMIRVEPIAQKNFSIGCWCNFTASFVIQLVCIWLMQKKSSYGDVFEYHEDGPLNALGISSDANYISKVVRASLIALVIVFTFTDTVIIGSVLSHGQSMAARIMKWRMDHTLKDCYDEYGDDCKYRARGYGGMAPN